MIKPQKYIVLRRVVLFFLFTINSIMNAQMFKNSENIFNTTEPNIYEIDTLFPEILSQLNKKDSSFKYVKITKVSIFQEFTHLYLTERFKISTHTNSYPDTFFNINNKLISYYYAMPPTKRGLDYLRQYDSIWVSLKWVDRDCQERNKVEEFLDETEGYYLNESNHPFKLDGFYFWKDSLYTIEEYMLLYDINNIHKLYINSIPINRVILNEIRYRRIE